MTVYTHLRTHLRQQRRALTPIDSANASASVVMRLNQHSTLTQCSKIAGYLSTDGEVDLHHWFEHAWNASKQCYLPVVRKKHLVFAHYTQKTPLCPNQWGILEPITDKIVSPVELDAIILPLVAFDSEGHRLGRGGGYYDRSLAWIKQRQDNKTPYLIGIGYAFQQVSSLTPQAWDIPMNAIVTDTETLYCA